MATIFFFLYTLQWMTVCGKKGHFSEAKTRETVLNAAISEFAEFGFAGARMERIAKNAKVNKAMLHYYFHDKDTLYSAVLGALYGDTPAIDLFAQELEAADLNSVQFIHVFLKILIAKHSDKRSSAFRRILAWELASTQNLKRVAQKYMVPRIAALAAIIERGVKSGELQCANPILAVWGLISQVAFYFGHQDTYIGSPIYEDLYAKVTPDLLCRFLLDNFIATYAKGTNLDSKIPTRVRSKIERLTEELVKV